MRHHVEKKYEAMSGLNNKELCKWWVILVRTASDRNPHGTAINKKRVYWLTNRVSCGENCLRPKEGDTTCWSSSLSTSWVCLILVGSLSHKGSFYWVGNVVAGSTRHVDASNLATLRERDIFLVTLVEKPWVASDWIGFGNLSVSKPKSMARRESTLVLGCVSSVLCQGVEHCD